MQIRCTAILVAPDEIHRRTVTRALDARKATVASVLTD